MELKWKRTFNRKLSKFNIDLGFLGLHTEIVTEHVYRLTKKNNLHYKRFQRDLMTYNLGTEDPLYVSSQGHSETSVTKTVY